LLLYNWESADCLSNVRLSSMYIWLCCVESELLSLLGALVLIVEQGGVVRVLITTSSLFVCWLFRLSERITLLSLDLRAALSRLPLLEIHDVVTHLRSHA